MENWWKIAVIVFLIMGIMALVRTLGIETRNASRGSGINPHWHYEHEPETKAALDLIFSEYFSRNEPGAFDPIRATLLTHGDHYMHLADLAPYLRAQDQLGDLYSRPGEWARKAILNVGSSGKFSSDRTIHEYTTEIWEAEPCPIP